MIALIQRVLEARVTVAGQTVGEIGPGLLALLAVEKGDAPANAARMVERLLGYRVFPDAEGRMNLSLADTGGELLLVSQFLLLATSSFVPTAHFGVLTAVGLLSGQLMELILLPALLVLWSRVEGRFRRA